LKNIVTELSFYEKIKNINKKIKISQTEEYYKKVINITDKKSLENIKDVLKNTKEISISYRYYGKYYFALTILIDEIIYNFSDDIFVSKTNLTKFIINYVLKVDKIYLYNLKHFIKPLLDIFSEYELRSLNNRIYDVQLADYTINLNKDNHLFDNYNKYSKKVKVILQKVHGNQAAHYYVHRHILQKVMIFESVFLYYYGTIFRKIQDKLEQEMLQKRMQLFSFTLSDIEQENLIVDINKFGKWIEDENKVNAFFKKLLKYCSEQKTNLISASYKHNNTKTGRLTFNNKNKINMMSMPKTKIRELIIPENDKFLSMDINGMEVFYFIKNYTNILENIEIKSDFDIYKYIDNQLKLNVNREIIKNTIIKLLYGAGSYKSEEVMIKQIIIENYPELDAKNRIDKEIPNYIQTKFKRIIHINKNYNKLLNNFIQSESNDLMINNITLLWYNMKKLKLKSKIKILIHDQIIIDCIEEEISIIKTLLNKTIKDLPFTLVESNTFYLD
jgi:hypothetical protein